MAPVSHFGFDHETVSVTLFVTYPIYLPMDLPIPYGIQFTRLVAPRSKHSCTFESHLLLRSETMATVPSTAAYESEEEDLSSSVK